MNGVNFAHCSGLINNIEFTGSGKIICGFFENKLVVVDPISLDMKVNLMLFIRYLEPDL